jgi:hypothetical protein
MATTYSYRGVHSDGDLSFDSMLGVLTLDITASLPMDTHGARTNVSCWIWLRGSSRDDIFIDGIVSRSRDFLMFGTSMADERKR